MPFGAIFVFAGFSILPARGGRDRKPRVGDALPGEACLRVVADEADECDAIPAEHFFEARDEKRLLRYQKHLACQDLLIVDELGFVPLSRTGTEMLFEIFSQR